MPNVDDTATGRGENMTNTNELERLIDESGYKRGYIAKSMGITAYALSRKINNKNEFKASEIEKLCSILGIDNLETRQRVFFCVAC